MANKNLSMTQAFTWVENEFSGILRSMEMSKTEIKSYGPEVDAAIRSYVYGLEQWVYGSTMWDFDMTRYFGIDNKEVQRTLIVKLKLPEPAEQS